MANKYKVSKLKTTNKNKPSSDMSKDKTPLIGKGKILAILIAGTILVAGIYAYAISLKFMFIFHIYWIVTAILFCLFIFLSMRNDYLYHKCMSLNKHATKEADSEHRGRTKIIKYVLLALLPFLFTVMADAIYLILIKDSQVFKSIAGLFSAK